MYVYKVILEVVCFLLSLVIPRTPFSLLLYALYIEYSSLYFIFFHFFFFKWEGIDETFSQDSWRDFNKEVV